MNNKIIQDYIQFVIDNGYTLENDRWYMEDNYFYDISIKEGFLHTRYKSHRTHYIELITSKQFIESVARGLYKESLSQLRIDKLTINQAIAIRDGKLEQFITNLGIIGTEK